MSNRIQLRRGTAAAWASANPILAQGEIGYITDTGDTKTGDGVTAWTSLPSLSSTYVPKSLAKTGLFIPSDWGQFIYPALRAAKAGTGKAVIHFVGDSITQGFYSSDLLLKSFVGLATTAMQSAYGDGGIGWFGVANSTLVAGTASYPANNSWALVGTWTLQTDATQYGGPGFCSIYSAASLGTTQTATATLRGTKLTIYYNQFSGGGTFTPIIDGVSQTAVSTNGANSLASVSYTVAAGSHTLQLSIAPSQGNVIFYGASGENSTGTVVNRFGRSGAQSSMVNNNATTYGTSAYWTGGPSYPADLVVYGMHVNDAGAGVTADTFLGNLTTYLSVVRDASGTAPKNGKTDLIVLMPHVGKNDYSTPVSPSYFYRLRSLCEHYGAALVDVGAVYQNSYAQAAANNYWSDGTSSGLPGTNTVHPGDAGNLAIWNLLKPLLTAA